MKRVIATFFSFLLFVPLSCAEEYIGENPPTKSFHFPTGIAISPVERTALVVSSNFDLGYNRGVVHSIDLDRVDAALLAKAGAALDAPLTDVISDAVYVQNFGGPIRFDDSGAHAFVAMRGDGSLLQLDVADASQGRTLDCAGEGETEDCSQGPQHVLLQGDDPYSLLLRADADGRQRVYVGDLNAAGLQSLDFDPAQQPGDRLQANAMIDSGLLRTGALAILPADAHHGDYILMAGNSYNDPAGRIDGAYLRLLDVDLDAEQNLGTVPLVSASQASDARAVVVSPDGRYAYVAQRSPSSVALLDLSLGPNNLPTFQITAVQSIGLNPVAMVMDADAAGGPQVLVACFDDQTIYALDAHSLQVVGVLENLQGGPADMAIDSSTGRLYVSLFDRDTIMIVGLERDDNPGLRRLGYIAEPRPLPTPDPTINWDPRYWF